MSNAVTVYVKHNSGALHSITGRRAASLAKECLAGRGMREIVELQMAGYEGFLDETVSGDDMADLDTLPEYFAKKKVTK